MKHKLKTLASALVLSALGSTAAQAGVVTVWGEALSGFSLSTINNFYNGLPGHSSSIAAGTLDTVNLSGVNLLWATQPADAYTAAELTTMANFLGGGGRIAFMGEHGTFAPAQNTRINAALVALGSTISINNVILDSGFRSASVVDGQILSHPLTTGVSTYEYAAFAPLTVSGTAQTLMLGEDLFGGNPSVMMAYQNIGPGSIFLITDQNVWDNSPTWGSFDNERMFENLLSGNTGAPPVGGTVPAPATLGLLGAGLVGLSALRRREKA
ncbi:MAG: PEP-CTERM sorting domain-containing protein [Immundisolibacter sp.]|uniref:PEP-CTERM sorting domain-containing protein n=1 Tax=Immundisolibacter sp. TaxID=1934948 RepID=UPI003D0BBEEC